MNNLETVKAIYEAFLKGDIPFILNNLADDVEWGYAVNNEAEKAGVPWMKPCSGRENVINFFKAVDEMGIYHFEALSFLANESQIAVKLDIKCKYFVDEVIHLWTFNNEGQVLRYEQFLDTAKTISGYQMMPKSVAA